MDLSRLSEALSDELDSKTSAREQGLSGSRDTIRACGNAIRAMHRQDFETATSLLSDAQSNLEQSRSALRDHPDMRYAGFIHDAEKEVAEACITLALVRGEELPSREEVDVPAQAYLKGMAESMGELRRHILDQMRRGDLERCERLLASMDDIYNVLISMDYPDGITFGLRRLTDVARSIIERTRGDFTTSKIQSSLHDALEEHSALLRSQG